jgi:hypothetical protein
MVSGLGSASGIPNLSLNVSPTTEAYTGNYSTFNPVFAPTSGTGNASQTQSSSNIILYIVIGIVAIAVIYFLVRR